MRVCTYFLYRKNNLIDMLEKYDEFSQKKKNIDNQMKQQKQKMAGLKKQKLQLRMDKLKKKFSQFVAGASNYDTSN